MSVEGIILHHGEAHGVTLHQTRVDYLVSAENSKQCSLFEFPIALGFSTGAHYHTKIEEIFYVIEGELDLRCGESIAGRSEGLTEMSGLLESEPSARQLCNFRGQDQITRSPTHAGNHFHPIPQLVAVRYQSAKIDRNTGW